MDHKDTTVNSVQLCSLQFSSVLSFRSHVEMLHVTYGDTLGWNNNIWMKNTKNECDFLTT